jgi:hypothetical protein
MDERSTRIVMSVIDAANRGDLTSLADEIRAALEGDSNDAEHDALASVAAALGIEIGV